MALDAYTVTHLRSKSRLTIVTNSKFLLLICNHSFAQAIQGSSFDLFAVLPAFIWVATAAPLWHHAFGRSGTGSNDLHTLVENWNGL